MKNSNKNIKVAVGLSGGVDSAVSAHLLKEAGYDVTGVYMQCWEVEEDGCAANPDRSYAVQGASHIGIKIEQLDFIKEYKSKVIDYFYKEYESGRTPNPDVMCNKEIKFGIFYDWAIKNGFDYVATGHYARIENVENVFGYSGLALLKGIDKNKDQSYFLYPIKKDQLAKIMFPVGNMIKDDVRALALKVGLPNANRPDSTGICFIGEVDIREFLEKRISSKKGLVKTLDGEVIGDHEGVWYYTIGQRKGFNVNTYSEVPLYVIRKDTESNTLFVAPKEKAYSDSFIVKNPHWLIQPSEFPIICDVRIRHLGEDYKCILHKVDQTELRVEIEEPVFAVAEGQSAVFYSRVAGVVVGGGVIQYSN